MSDDLTPALLGSATYAARVTPLRSGGRRDIEVRPHDENLPAAFGQTDIVARLRQFFSALEAEAHEHAGDPVATSQALARMEALLADVRYARDTIRRLAAQSLAAEKVRRLTIGNVCTVEATTEVKRTDWQHHRLLTDMLSESGIRGLSEHGEVIEPTDLADTILSWLRPEWRMTPIKAAGLNPDAYCAMMTDDDGNPIREPAVRMVDNHIRKITT